MNEGFNKSNHYCHCPKTPTHFVKNPYTSTLPNPQNFYLFIPQALKHKNSEAQGDTKSFSLHQVDVRQEPTTHLVAVTQELATHSVVETQEPTIVVTQEPATAETQELAANFIPEIKESDDLGAATVAVT
jgi:hypothetical protein